MDLYWDRISNHLIIIGLITGLFYQIQKQGIGAGIMAVFIGMGISMIILYPLFLVRGIGAGDVKLFMVAGCFLDPQNLIYSIVAAFLIGAFISLIKIIINFFMKKKQKAKTIHFSVPILFGTLLIMGGVL